MVFNHGIHRIHGMIVSLVLLFGVAVSAVAAELGITVEARQRYPWNGLVDLKFTITGESDTRYDTSFTAKDMVGGTNIAMKTIRKSNGVAAEEKEKLLPGTYNWVWDAAADLPKDFKCERMTVTGMADISAFPYTVKFNANGGTGSMANQSFTYGTAKALTANAFTRTGYVFQGWATSASGGKVYNDKQSVKDLTTTSGAVVNLYAVWKEVVRDKVQLWEGGPYWATMNIGAKKSSDVGYYFWWGDVLGYKFVNNTVVTSDGSPSDIRFQGSEGNVPTTTHEVKNLVRDGWLTDDYILVPKHDAAHVHMGVGWRMPTHQEFVDLNSKCEWTWTRVDGTDGYMVRGKGNYSSASIFLPVTGYIYGSSVELRTYGTYWSSRAYYDGYSYWSTLSYRLNFSSSGYKFAIGSYDSLGERYVGCPIRPVFDR